jgi:alkyl hydroperoxide reductase subunit AhpC
MHTNFLEVGDEVPAFNLDSQMGRIGYRELIDGKWGMLVTFNTAFDPVATTDMGMLAKLMDEFDSRNIYVCAVGTDNGMSELL